MPLLHVICGGSPSQGAALGPWRGSWVKTLLPVPIYSLAEYISRFESCSPPGSKSYRVAPSTRLWVSRMRLAEQPGPLLRCGLDDGLCTEAGAYDHDFDEVDHCGDEEDGSCMFLCVYENSESV